MENQKYSLKRRIFELFWRVAKPSVESQSVLSEFLAPNVTVNTHYGELHFFCPGGRTVGRAKTLLTKERDTIAWIDSFEDGLFWDVGANVGVFTLYAGTKGHDVMAFEPSPANHFLLAKNIEINNLDAKSFCLAFSQRTAITTLNMGRLGYGFADAELESNRPIKVSAISYTVDEFVETFNLDLPRYVKIDVDGGEVDILEGAKMSFSSPIVEQIQIEVDARGYERINCLMEGFGFTGNYPDDFDENSNKYLGGRKSKNILYVK